MSSYDHITPANTPVSWNALTAEEGGEGGRQKGHLIDGQRQQQQGYNKLQREKNNHNIQPPPVIGKPPVDIDDGGASSVLSGVNMIANSAYQSVDELQRQAGGTETRTASSYNEDFYAEVPPSDASSRFEPETTRVERAPSINLPGLARFRKASIYGEEQHMPASATTTSRSGSLSGGSSFASAAAVDNDSALSPLQRARLRASASISATTITTTNNNNNNNNTTTTTSNPFLMSPVSENGVGIGGVPLSMPVMGGGGRGGGGGGGGSGGGSGGQQGRLPPLLVRLLGDDARAPWYNDRIERKRIEALMLMSELGDYLVRVSSSGNAFTLMVMGDGNICLNFRLFCTAQGVRVDGHRRHFHSVGLLIHHYSRNPLTREGDRLLRPASIR